MVCWRHCHSYRCDLSGSLFYFVSLVLRLNAIQTKENNGVSCWTREREKKTNRNMQILANNYTGLFLLRQFHWCVGCKSTKMLKWIVLLTRLGRFFPFQISLSSVRLSPPVSVGVLQILRIFDGWANSPTGRPTKANVTIKQQTKLRIWNCSAGKCAALRCKCEKRYCFPTCMNLFSIFIMLSVP